MSKLINNYAVLFNNPFILTPLIQTFYGAITPRPRNILLSYVVLPLVLMPKSREFLVTATIKSSPRTFAAEPERLFGLQDRIRRYKPLTELCMQWSIDLKAVKMNPDLSITSAGEVTEITGCPAEALRAAKNLGKILSPFEIPSIYRYLGIKHL